MTDPRQRFQELLRRLFQFDAADLDFGIYRILNQKRAVIEDFIESGLLGSIDQELSKGAVGQQVQVAADLAEAATAVRTNLGEEAIHPDGTLAEPYVETPLGQRYLEIQSRTSSFDTSGLETVVFNHLYAFFGRYYEAGDFVTKRRYGQREKYAIPYNGEEVFLHWANSDQYYIKTAERFSVYRFQSAGFKVEFALSRATTARDNTKADDLYFVPLPNDTSIDSDSSTVTIILEHRPLTQNETQRARRDTQRTLITDSMESLGKKIGKQDPEARASLWRPSPDGPEVTELEFHLRRFVARNASDFFVHKSLREFLLKELDFFLKNEVLNLEDLSTASSPHWDATFQLLNVIRNSALTIIDFLSHIEDFQRDLFTKKKFVRDVEYCVRVDVLPDSLRKQVLENADQWNEWMSELHLEDESADLGAADSNKSDVARLNALENYPTLLVDTRHFSRAFREELLAGFDDLDSEVEALLIQGENFQALNLIREKYRGHVNAVYIDPPYNTSGSEILYKNSYKHSSWLTLMANRLDASRALLAPDAIQCTTIDDAESAYLHALLERTFGRENYLATVAIRSNPHGRAVPSGFSPNHDYAIFYSVSNDAEVGRLPRDEVRLQRYRGRDEDGIFTWSNLRATGANSWRPNRPKLFYPIFVSDEGTIEIPEMDWDNAAQEWVPRLHGGGQRVFPIDESGTERVWGLGWERARRDKDKLLEARRVGVEGSWQIYRKFRPNQSGALPGTWWHDAKYSATESGTKVLNDILGSSGFSYPKSIHAVVDSLRACNLEEDGLALDYFAGSGTTGHAVINLNRQDSGRRRFILVEMGEYFDKLLLRRIKRICFAPEWRDGKPSRLCTPDEVAATPRVIKYLRLESYDDTLNSIDFEEDDAQALDFDDYVVRYMLRWGTRSSVVLPSASTLEKPFDLQIRVVEGGSSRTTAVDVPETFSFLIGLQTKAIRTKEDQGRKYVVYRGTIEGRRVAVVWRDVGGWVAADYGRDRDFLLGSGMLNDVDEVMNNGDSLLPGASSLDALFARLMMG